MSEILTAIKLIKFYAWESYFRDRVGRVRRKEFSRLLNGIVVKVWTFCVVFGAPVLAMLGCLCVKVLSPDFINEDEDIRAKKIFTVLALFYTVRWVQLQYILLFNYVISITSFLLLDILL
jgi:hypothetical protein